MAQEGTKKKNFYFHRINTFVALTDIKLRTKIQKLYDVAYFIKTSDQITFDALPTAFFRFKSSVELLQCGGICG